MSKKNFRIFISYRGNTEGKVFAKNLYKYLNEDPSSIEKYGEVYYSEEEEKSGNFMYISRVMSSVECFVLPLTHNFFSDFKEQGDESPTYNEIKEALKNPRMHFIAVQFDNFQFDKKLITDLFGDAANKLWGCKLIRYNDNNEMQTLRVVGDELVRDTFTVRSIRDFEKTPNIHLAFKRDTENPRDYPYYERLYDVDRITLMNFAATTFMAGYDIATIYESSDYLRRLFQSRLMSGDITVEAVLTNPYSYAAIDAEKYKMFPSGATVSNKEIIINNLNSFYKFKERNPRANIKIYLTDIALPYGLITTEHKNKNNNHIKVDMYAPVPGEDGYRPSFYLLENKNDTKSIYEFYKQNLLKVKQDFSIEYKSHPDVEWLIKKHIIHKAKISNDVVAHTRTAFSCCMKKKFPIEVDLILLKDGTIVVGRQDELSEITGERDVTQMSWGQLKEEVKKNAVVDTNQILSLSSFLEYIHGVIPILLEIKDNNYSNDSDENNELVREVVEEVRKYIRKYGLGGDMGKVAIHSSNPYVLRKIRDKDCMIPIGQISLDFDRNEYASANEIQKKLHREQSFIDVVTPDFISYDIRDLPNPKVQNLCRQHNIPLIAWTIKDAADEEKAERYCKNIIIEGSTSYPY